jgi:hypothetical protein
MNIHYAFIVVILLRKYSLICFPINYIHIIDTLGEIHDDEIKHRFLRVAYET